MRSFRGNIVIVNGDSSFWTVKKGILMVFNASLYNINKAIAANDLKEPPLDIVVPKQYHEFLPLFSKMLADRFPQHQPGIDYEVRLNNRERPPWGPLYLRMRAELIVLNEWLDENQ
jgi:hypothetical protein